MDRATQLPTLRLSEYDVVWISGPPPTLFYWTEQRLIDFQRWGNRLSKTIPFREYRRSFKDRYKSGMFLNQ